MNWRWPIGHKARKPSRPELPTYGGIIELHESTERMQEGDISTIEMLTIRDWMPDICYNQNSQGSLSTKLSWCRGTILSVGCR